MVVLEVRREQEAVVVVHERLVQCRADGVWGGSVHLALDDTRVDPCAAVVDDRVVDDLELARLRVDLDDADVDLRRVGEREVAEAASTSSGSNFGR